MNRKERKARAAKKVLTYQTEFAKAAKKYAERMGDTPFNMLDIIMSEEVQASVKALYKVNPQEKALIHDGCRKYFAGLRDAIAELPEIEQLEEEV